MTSDDEQRHQFVERVLKESDRRRWVLLRQMKAYVQADRRGLRPDPKIGAELMRRSEGMLKANWAKQTLEAAPATKAQIIIP